MPRLRLVCRTTLWYSTSSLISALSDSVSVSGSMASRYAWDASRLHVPQRCKVAGSGCKDRQFSCTGR
eukprot:10532056-Prorocentrum_lima.AAC.1